ncbi:MAG: dodecin domain-containing protein [Bryobacterales bacterium]|nr:dodecin domain-containing protein [Bryobacterales bacterium]
MAQRVIEITGESQEGFSEAAANAAAEAAKSIQGIKWARITEFDMALDGAKVLNYRVTARIFYDA